MIARAAILAPAFVLTAPAVPARADVPDGVVDPGMLAIIGDAAIAPVLRAAEPLDLDATVVPVPGGWFVPVLGLPGGFATIDDGAGAPMASVAASLGGIATLGPPVGRPFATADGWQAQIFARAVIGWRPEDGAGAVLPAPGFLRQAGLDPIVAGAGVPPGAPPPVTAEEAWSRLAWITDPGTRAAYLVPMAPASVDPPAGSAPDLATFLGPPTSLAVTTGSQRRQRFERGIVEARVASADAPSVVAIGLLLRRATSLPASVTLPDTIVGGQVVVRGPAPVVPWRVDETVTSDGAPSHRSPPSFSAPSTLLKTLTGGEGGRTPTPGAGGNPAPPSATAAPGGRLAGAAIRMRSIIATGGTEQVVLANEGVAAQDLAGWALRSMTSTTRHAFPAGTRLEAGATLVVVSGRDSPTGAAPGRVSLGRGSLWRDDGGTAILLDRDGQEVDRRAFP